MDTPVIFICNGKEVRTFSHHATPLLDYIRKEINLTGTKEGCREGDCGACTVLIGENSEGGTSYKAVNSCLVPLGTIHGKHLVTIEGISRKALSPFEEALIDEGAIQCGFCTPGLLMSMTGFLLSDKYLKLEDAVDAVAGNICRCTGYMSIKRAIYRFLMESEMCLEPGRKRLISLIENGFIPNYFMHISHLLETIPEPKVSYSGSIKGIPIAGGTDLMVQKRSKILQTEFNFLRTDVEEKIKVENGFCILNAFSNISEVMNSGFMKSLLPQMENFIRLFGSHQIRNRATLGGNIVNASPAADMASILLGLDSTLVLKGETGKREIPLREFYLGYKILKKEADEMVAEIKFLLPAKGSFFNYEKISRRTHLDIASVNSSFYLEAENGLVKNIHISAGGVAPYPLYLKETVNFLIGREITFQNVRDAALIAQAECSPISDIRGSAEYKRLLLRQLIFAHFLKFSPELNETAEMMLIH